MEKKSFGIRPDGSQATLYTIENRFIRLQVTDHGATLVSAVLKPSGVDVVKGFQDVRGYSEGVPYMGATIGRVCNRIAKGTFVLHDKVYHTPINNGPNTLHGGTPGFNDRLWAVSETASGLTASYYSPDGECGFPGNLRAEVSYELLDHGFAFVYRGICDQDTYFNMTNHSFFNLAGLKSNDAMTHWLQIPADFFIAVDADGLATGRQIAVDGTPFDFRKGMEIGAHINDNDEQLKLGHGYDHHFCVNGSGFRKMAECRYGTTKMKIYSDLPGFQLYTGNFLDGKPSGGKENTPFGRRSTVSLETQYCPNAMNFTGQLVPLLKKDAVSSHRTEYLFDL